MITKQQILDCEANQLKKFKLLPNRYKQVGFGLVILATLGLIVLYVFHIEIDMLRALTRNVLLLAMLMVSISED